MRAPEVVMTRKRGKSRHQRKRRGKKKSYEDREEEGTVRRKKILRKEKEETKIGKAGHVAGWVSRACDS